MQNHKGFLFYWLVTLNNCYLALLLLSLVLIEFLIGGTRLLFSLPSYGLLSVAAVSTVFSFRRQQFPPSIVCLAASGLFVGYMLVRITTSPVEYLARYDFYTLLGALLVYLLVSFQLTIPKHRLWLVLGLLALALINISVGLIQYLRREHFPLVSFLQPADYGARASGLYICPDHMAGFLEVVAVLGLSAACWSRWSHWLKVCAGYVSLLCFIGIVLTGSRGGYVSSAFGVLAFIGLSLMALRKGRFAHMWPIALVLVLITGAIVTALTLFVSNQFTLSSRWVNLWQSGGADRVTMWEEAVKQFKLSPTFGTGSGTYLFYQRHFRGPMEFADAVYAHNDYLHILAEYGLAGMAAIVLLLGTHIGHGLKGFQWFISERLSALGRIQSDTLALNIGALSALSTYLIHSFVDFNLHIPANALLLAIVFGILANPGVELPFKTARFHKLNRYLRLALPLLGIFVAARGLPTLPAEYFAEQARVAVRDEQFAAGRMAALKGIRYDRTNPNLYLYLGEAYFGLGKSAPDPEVAELSFKAAAQNYPKGLALFRQDRNLLLGMAWSLDALKRFDEAESYYKEVLDWEANSAQVHAYYATHLRTAGKLDDAEAEYNRSMKLAWNRAAQWGLEQLAKERKPGGGIPPQ